MPVTFGHRIARVKQIARSRERIVAAMLGIGSIYLDDTTGSDSYIEQKPLNISEDKIPVNLALNDRR